MTVEIEIHDDEWHEWSWLPDEAWQDVGSTISINWTRIRITDPQWIVFATLRCPQLILSDAV